VGITLLRGTYLGFLVRRLLAKWRKKYRAFELACARQDRLQVRGWVSQLTWIDLFAV